MTQPPASLAPALDRLRRGDQAGARAALGAALEREPDAPALLAFAGFLAAQAGDPAAAIPYFRRVLALDPGDTATRINLATALIATGTLDEAGAVCADHGGDPKLRRFAAYILQQQGRLAAAAQAYEALLADLPGDFESWNNLGNVRLAQGDAEGAADAFRRAITLRPDILEMVLNLAEALDRAERHEDRRAVMREAARVSPDDPRVQAALGLAEYATRDFAAAERAYRAAIRLDPGQLSAWLELGLLLETLNRVDDLAALAEEARGHGLPEAELGFLGAWALRRQGRFAEALPLAEAVPATIDPPRRAQLVAELHDRLGNEEAAFAAFAEMNRAAAAAKPPAPGPSFRAQVAAAAAALTAERVAAWTRVERAAAPGAPAFIIGFPRSGTTLLGTLLTNAPGLHVLEEQPIIRDIEARLGPDADLARMTADEAREIRSFYFERLAAYAPPGPGRSVVDKHPLHMTRIALIHRLFPDAKLIFVERHPCDAVLSCFMANFQPTHAMRSFTDLEEAARTYDTVLDAWTRAESLLPLGVHRVRYERMVADPEGEMRPLLDFLGLPWDPAVLDNRAGAAGRADIRTPSYAQVTEPIYTRAAGRWERYRDQLAPVLPILAPWAERMGYEI